MNEICRKCEHLRNLVNGAYCMELKHYVEYHQDPPCNNQNLSENGKGNN